MLLAYADAALEEAVRALQRAGAEPEGSAAALLELLTLMGTFSALAALTRWGVVVTSPVTQASNQVVRLAYSGVAVVIEPVAVDSAGITQALPAPSPDIELARVISVMIDGVALTARSVGRSPRAALRSVSS